jgi:hypothetical protein
LQLKSERKCHRSHEIFAVATARRKRPLSRPVPRGIPPFHATFERFVLGSNLHKDAICGVVRKCFGTKPFDDDCLEIADVGAVRFRGIFKSDCHVPSGTVRYPRCKQCNPNRNNGEWRGTPNLLGGVSARFHS